MAVSTGLFLCAEVLLLSFGDRSELSAGILSILLALFYVAFPIFSTKALALLPNVPLGILVCFLWISGFSVLLLLCGAEFLFPVILGYFVIPIVHQIFHTTGAILVTIVFITVWILVRKYQWRLIHETWDMGVRLYELIIKPIVDLMETIWSAAEKLGRSVCK